MRLTKGEKLNILITKFEEQRIKFEKHDKKYFYNINEISDTIGEIGILDIELAFKLCEQLMEHIQDWDKNNTWGYAVQKLCRKKNGEKVAMMIANNSRFFQVYFNEVVAITAHPYMISEYIKTGRFDLADAALELIYSNKNYPGREGKDDRIFYSLGSIIHWLVFNESIDNIEFLIHWANKIKEKKDRTYALISILHLIKDINVKKDVLMEVFKMAKKSLKYEDRFEVSTLVGQASLIELELAIEIWSYYLNKSNFDKEFKSNRVISYPFTDTTILIFEELLKNYDYYSIMVKSSEDKLIGDILTIPELFTIQCQIILGCLNKKDYSLGNNLIQGIFNRIEIYEQSNEYIRHEKSQYIVEIIKSLSEADESNFHFFISIIESLKDEVEKVKAKGFIARFLDSSSEREEIYFDCFEALKDEYRQSENKAVLALIIEVATYDILIALKMLEYRILHFNRKKYKDYLFDYDRYTHDTLEEIYCTISSEKVVDFIRTNPEILKLTFKSSRYISKLHNKLITDFLNLKDFQIAETALTMIKYHHIKFNYGKLIRYIIVNSHLDKQDGDIKQFLYDFIMTFKKSEEKEKALIKSYFKDVNTR
ncbi:hypothetical protein MUB15_08370 [Priestia sp. OVS21]|nr:hypothetical protein [Priestia sp. OVS21]